MINDEILEFCGRLGLSGVNPSEGRVTLELEGIGRLTLQRGEDEQLTVMLSSAECREPAEATRRLLAASDWRTNPPFTVQAGSLRNRVFVLTRLPERAVRAAEIERALRYLAAQLGDALR